MQIRLYIILSIFLTSHLNVSAQQIYYNNFESGELEQKSEGVRVVKDDIRGFVLRCDGKSSAVSLKKLRCDSVVSFSAWIKPENLDLHASSLLSQYKIFQFRIMGNRILRFTCHNRYVEKSLQCISEGVWQHVGFCYSNSGKLKIFYNGELISEKRIPNGFLSKKQGFVLASDHTNSHFEGYIDNVSIWNRELTNKEFYNEYKETYISPVLDSGLKLWVPLDGLDNTYEGKSKLKRTENIVFKDDSRFGKVACFNEKSKIVYDKIDYDRVLSVSAWVKPSKNGRFNTICGSNSFILRLQNHKPRSLFFTVPFNGERYSKAFEWDYGEWIHVVAVTRFHRNVEFYVNGKLLDKISFPLFNKTADEIIIGHSFYNDTYKGCMSNLGIWNRALSPMEIKKLYHRVNPVIKTQSESSYIFYIIIMILLLAGALIYIFILRSKRNYLKAACQRISFLGQFCATNRESIDISNEFTPRIIQLLFIITVWPLIKGRNIKSHEISDTLWPDEEERKKKNNRNANIKRLRSVLSELGDVKLLFENNNWRIEYGEAFEIDIINIFNKKEFYFEGNNNSLSKSLIIPELDSVLSEFNTILLERLIEIGKSFINSGNFKQLLYLSELISGIEYLSEIAIVYKLKALKALKRYDEAKREEVNFRDKFFELHREKFTGNLPV